MTLGASPTRTGLNADRPTLPTIADRDVARLAMGYLGLHLLLWTLLPAMSHISPPWDNVEQLTWLQSLQWGYYKHPPAPTWWMWGWTVLLGRSVWASFFAAQLNVALMLACVWRLARLYLPPARAFVAVVLTSLEAYHGLRGIMANHNTLQLLPVGLLLLAAMRCARAPCLAGWAGLGTAAALCLLSKYSALVWFLALAAWAARDVRFRRRSTLSGVAVAVGVFALLMTPHALWLMREGCPPLRYAEHALLGAAGQGEAALRPDVAGFLLTQLARLAPLLLGFAAISVGVRKTPRRHVRAAPGIGPGDAWFLTCITWVPIGFTTFIGVAGLQTESSWATTFFVASGIWTMRFLPEVENRALLRCALSVGVALQLLLSGGLALGRGWLVDRLGRATRSNYPAPALARQLDALWVARQPGPLRVVAGETWTAGSFSLHSAFQPLVLIDGNLRRAPAVSEELLKDCGMLVLADRTPDSDPLPAAVAESLARAGDRGSLAMPWTSRSDGPILQIDWGIIAPEPGRPACSAGDRPGHRWRLGAPLEVQIRTDTSVPPRRLAGTVPHNDAARHP